MKKLLLILLLLVSCENISLFNKKCATYSYVSFNNFDNLSVMLFIGKFKGDNFVCYRYYNSYGVSEYVPMPSGTYYAGYKVNINGNWTPINLIEYNFEGNNCYTVFYENKTKLYDDGNFLVINNK